MFNLHIYKSNDFSTKRKDMITTLHNWTIDGKVIDVKENQKGFWLTVKTSAKISELYSMDRLEFDCFLPREVANTSYKKDSYLKKLHASGKFVFKKNSSYFLVEKMLVQTIQFV